MAREQINVSKPFDLKFLGDVFIIDDIEYVLVDKFNGDHIIKRVDGKYFKLTSGNLIEVFQQVEIKYTYI